MHFFKAHSPNPFTYLNHPGSLTRLSQITSVNYTKLINDVRKSSRAWYDELKSFLISNHSKPTIFYPSLFIHHSTTSPIYILAYVDDIIITGPNSSLISSFINSLANKFSLKNLGNLSYFLGIEVLHHSRWPFSFPKHIHTRSY